MSKNLVIFSDGTGQEGGVGSNTNVYELFNMIEDRTGRQISFYDRGLGTGWFKVGQITGGGISRNIRECYQFLAENFSAGDRIYLFGFSRGATTVRTLSAFIHLFGILPRSRPELIRRAWRIYKIRNPTKKLHLAERFVHRNHTMWTRVRFLGVWDTVAALGLPFKALNVLIDKIPFWRHSFHDLKLAESVEYGRHALAIDDERKIFAPQLWDERGRPPHDVGRDGIPRRFGVDDGFTVEDISDIYLVAEKLKTPEHPVSKRLDLSDSTTRLLADFDQDGKRRESPRRIEALKAAAVCEFNQAVFNPDVSIYDPDRAEEFSGLALSSAVRERCDRFRRDDQESVRWLDRLLIQEAYALRPRHAPRIKQIWFTGMHTDVGGGYPEGELAHIPLVWMLREAIDLGLLIYEKHHVDITPDAAGPMHDSRARLGRLYRRQQRSWNRDKNQGRSPRVHESVVMRRSKDPVYDPWILKTDYEVEPWPQRQRGSIQFDEHHIWRESFWGWKGAFAVRWDDVERIACDEQARTVTLYLEDPRQDVVIRGCLPKALQQLVSDLELHRGRKHGEREDARFNKLLGELNEKVAALESRLQPNDERTSKPDRKGDDPSSLDRQRFEPDENSREELDELKGQIAKLTGGAESPATNEDAGPGLIKH